MSLSFLAAGLPLGVLAACEPSRLLPCRDPQRLHSAMMRAGESHAGIVLAAQQRYIVGEQMRRLLRLTSTLTAEDMRNRIEFLNAWV